MQELITKPKNIFISIFPVIIIILLIIVIWHNEPNNNITNFNKQNIKLEKQGMNINKQNGIIFYADINFNDHEPFHLLPGNELVIFTRIPDENKLPGSSKDIWYYKSLRFQGELNYNIKISTSQSNKDYQIINLSEISETGISNIINWLTFNLPENEKKIVNNPNRHSITIQINSINNNSNIGEMSNINGILYTGINYKSDSNFFSDYKLQLRPSQRIEICRIESKYKRLPTGEYDYDDNGNIKLKAFQKKIWKYKSIKIDPTSLFKLTILEENPKKSKNNKIEYDSFSLEYTIKYNIINLIVWMELKDQKIVKYSPYKPIYNERIYFIELLS